ncbi:ALF repeat-containing protein, partial [Streptomyces sp. NPDC004012]
MGQYQAGAQDFRVAIAQIINAGGPVVQQTGRTALDSDDPQKYREFLTTGQYQARTQDERVRAAQLIDSGGPQIKSSGRIALEGPDDLLDQFIQVGQYKAQRQDFLGATRTAQIQQLIADAAGVAATAQENAAEAHKAAATAAKAAQQAADWARRPTLPRSRPRATPTRRPHRPRTLRPPPTRQPPPPAQPPRPPPPPTRRQATQPSPPLRFPRDAGRGDRGSDGFHERSPDDACAEEVPA